MNKTQKIETYTHTLSLACILLCADFYKVIQAYEQNTMQISNIFLISLRSNDYFRELFV